MSTWPDARSNVVVGGTVGGKVVTAVCVVVPAVIAVASRTTVVAGEAVGCTVVVEPDAASSDGPDRKGPDTS